MFNGFSNLKVDKLEVELLVLFSGFTFFDKPNDNNFKKIFLKMTWHWNGK